MESPENSKTPEVSNSIFNKAGKVLEFAQQAERLNVQTARPKWRSGRNCESCRVPLGGILKFKTALGNKEEDIKRKEKPKKKSKWQVNTQNGFIRSTSARIDQNKSKSQSLAKVNEEASPLEESVSKAEKNSSAKVERKIKKHHCRYCGGIFCAKCAKDRVAIPSMGYDEPVRVCNDCFEIAYLESLQWNAFHENTFSFRFDREVQTSEEREYVNKLERDARRAERKAKKLEKLKASHSNRMRVNNEKSIFHSDYLSSPLSTFAPPTIKTIRKANDSRRFAMSEIDPIFLTIPRHVYALKIWRVEFFEVEPWPEEQYGKFYDGDSYLILHIRDCLDNPEKNALEHHIYYWLGERCHYDQRAVAAIKASELCRHFDGSAIIHRETQQEESPHFKDIFSDGIEYLHGGIESGLNSVKELISMPYVNRLFHIKGENRIFITQVEVSWKSLNSGDVFILDSEDKIFLWTGKFANRYERARALEFLNLLREERKKAAIAYNISNGDPDERSYTDFWSLMGGIPFRNLDDLQGGRVHESGLPFIRIKGNTEVESDNNVASKAVLDLYTVEETDLDGFELKIQPRFFEDSLSRKQLDSSKFFVLDCDSEVFIWIGKRVSKEIKDEGMKLVMIFLDYYERPNWTPVTRMMESAETSSFKSKFKDWYFEELMKTFDSSKPVQREKRSESLQDLIDLSKFFKVDPILKSNHLRNLEIEKSFQLIKRHHLIPNPTCGEVSVQEIVGTELETIDASKYGLFYQNSGYIVVFTFGVEQTPDLPLGPNGEKPLVDGAKKKYRQGQKQNWIFFWEGKKCPKLAIITWKLELSADLQEMLEFTYGISPITFFIRERQEPDFFLELFPEDMIIFKERGGEESMEQQMFQLRKKGSKAVALEVDCIVQSLNDRDIFVIRNHKILWVWIGQYSASENQEIGFRIGQKLAGERDVRLLTSLTQSSDMEFCELLQLDSTNIAHISSSPPPDNRQAMPRLFQCSVATGKFGATEIFNFDQDDLISDDVMLMDAYNELYVWIGASARSEERTMTLELAREYILLVPDDRPKDCPIIEIREGSEPLEFTRHFHGWDHFRKKFQDPFK